ncbi:MAG: VOC family protein [Acidobacteria bacterium]|nr:VOC family protein [Acidobacteriota bacterium]
MAEFKIPEPNTICWRELRTKDLDAAVRFYSEMFGWALDQSKLSPVPYKEITMDGTAAGGMMQIDENWPPGVPSHWASYVAVTSADETVAKIAEHGGSVRVPPFDAPGVGRMAMVADPSGADFAIIQFTEPA